MRIVKVCVTGRLNKGIVLREREHIRGVADRGNANMRDRVAHAYGAGEANGGRATNAYDAVYAREAAGGIVDDLGRDVEDGGVEYGRCEVGDEGFDMANNGCPGRAGDDERARQV